MTETNERIEGLKDDLAAECTDLEQKLKAAETRINEYQNAIFQAGKLAAELHNRKNELENKIFQLESELASLRTMTEERVRKAAEEIYDAQVNYENHKLLRGTIPHHVIIEIILRNMAGKEEELKVEWDDHPTLPGANYGTYEFSCSVQKDGTWDWYVCNTPDEHGINSREGNESTLDMAKSAAESALRELMGKEANHPNAKGNE
jgi:DNA repair exonuclease SbcCD ATPase subunit